MNPKGPERIGEIVSRLFAARGWDRKQERLRLERAWAEAVGPEYSQNTRVAAIRRSALEIEVRGTILFQELAQFHKRRLLEAVRKLLPGVTIAELRFRSGTWKDPEPKAL